MSAGEDLVRRKDVLQMGKVRERGGERRKVKEGEEERKEDRQQDKSETA